MAKQKAKKSVVSFNISDDSRRLVEWLADRLGCSRSEVVERCLNGFVVAMQAAAPIVRNPVVSKAFQEALGRPEVEQELAAIYAASSMGLPGKCRESLPEPETSLGIPPGEPGADVGEQTAPSVLRSSVHRRRPYKRGKPECAIDGEVVGGSA